jgi:hypothetical protein
MSFVLSGVQGNLDMPNNSVAKLPFCLIRIACFDHQVEVDTLRNE